MKDLINEIKMMAELFAKGNSKQMIELSKEEVAQVAFIAGAMLVVNSVDEIAKEEIAKMN